MDKYEGEDPYGLLRGLDQIYNGNLRKQAFHSAWDRWDSTYGVGKRDFIVYILADETENGHFTFGPLTLYNNPRYVGSGKKDRHIDSAAVGRQRDKGGEKVKWLEEMQNNNRKVKTIIVKEFYTEKKARVVEMKLLNLIPKSLLTNCEFPFCELSLTTADFDPPQNMMYF